MFVKDDHKDSIQIFGAITSKYKRIACMWKIWQNISHWENDRVISIQSNHLEGHTRKPHRFGGKYIRGKYYPMIHFIETRI